MKISIIGADELGATIARKLAETDAGCRIVLCDENEGMARGKALDIAQSAPLLGFAPRLEGTADLERTAGSGLIIFSSWDAAARDEAAAAKILGRLGQLSRNAVLISAPEKSEKLLALAITSGAFDERRALGSCPLALASSGAHMLAEELRVPSYEIKLMVLGALREKLIIPWSVASSGGVALERLVPAAVMRRISEAIKKHPPLGPYLLAAAAARLAREVMADGCALYPGLACSDGSYCPPGHIVALPIRLGRSGIIAIEKLRLDPVESTALLNAARA